jgi:uncharacterized membrane protein AbrB (regulator of aidB expression)
MDYLLAFYLLGCLVNITILHKDLVDAWSSKVPKSVLIVIWVIVVFMSWLYLIVRFRMNRNNR